MYETNIAKFSKLNKEVAHLKQSIDWNNLNNSILFDKTIWQKINDDIKNSLDIENLSNFRWEFGNTTQIISDALQVLYQNILNNTNLLQVNFEDVIKSSLDSINSYVLSQDFMDSLKNVQKSLDMIENILFDKLFSGIDYNKEDLVNEMEEISIDLQNHLQCENDDSIDSKMQIENFWTNLKTKHPKLYIIIVLFNTIVTFAGDIDVVSNIIPKIEDTFVYFQGNSDFYFIKEDCAKIYEEASSQTNVIDFIYYGEEVIKLEDAKLWVKVLCKGKSGNPVIGWVAKRNLMSYKDYQFNSDKLYDID